MMKVGFIGLGTMGKNAALNLIRAGFQLVVHDIRTEAGGPLIERGATWADSPAAVAVEWRQPLRNWAERVHHRRRGFEYRSPARVWWKSRV